MPFIDKETRLELEDRVPHTSGERCYVEYQKLLVQWNKNPHWTTIDRLYKELKEKCPCDLQTRSAELAWQVFFNLVVMPYELQKQKENGDIELKD